ncbi:MAG: glycosyltransferase family 2 protein [Candidatus Binatia bacterium]
MFYGGDVAAVVLCWNDGERVLRLLRGLQAASPPPGRVIVVDNGSSDGSLARLAAAFPELEILSLDSNLGFAAAANRGMRAALSAGAGWVWLLNTDLVLPPDALARLLAAAGSDPRCGMAGAVLTEADGSVQARGGGRWNAWTASLRHAVSEGDRCDYLSGACLLLRATMLDQCGLFDEDYFFYWEDVELGFRVRERGWTLAVADDCRVVHVEGSTLGRWSEERWYHLFRGVKRFARARSRLPRVAVGWRLARHSATMLRHGRGAAVKGAWRAVAARPPA